jgi:hypothetical protein
MTRQGPGDFPSPMCTGFLPLFRPSLQVFLSLLAAVHILVPTAAGPAGRVPETLVDHSSSWSRFREGTMRANALALIRLLMLDSRPERAS